jgi:pimeloyl-ACP methyl ester carboxylesterase
VGSRIGWRSGGRLLVAAVALAGCSPGAPPPDEVAAASIVTESYHVPTADPGIELYVRNKRPDDLADFRPDNVVLFVHGATYPAETAFDLPLDGFSWMDFIAQRGYDVYLMDLRGYGRSSRPPEMSEPPGAHGPLVDTTAAIADFGTVVDHVLERRAIPRLTVMGWSWGTTIVGGFAARHGDRVEKLVMYAPVWTSEPGPETLPPPTDAYREVTREAALARWLNGVPEDRHEATLPPEWYDAWWQANMEAGPVGAARTPPVIQAPNGVLQDLRGAWANGTALYDPADIAVPTLLVVAEWDADTPVARAQGVFAALTRTPRKRLVVIGEGTHTVIMEKNRQQLFEEVQLFLDEAH